MNKSCKADGYFNNNSALQGSSMTKKNIVVMQNTSTNTKRDAVTAWDNHCKSHLKMNGLGCDISKNELCKYWFIMGYNVATAPIL